MFIHNSKILFPSTYIYIKHNFRIILDKLHARTVSINTIFPFRREATVTTKYVPPSVRSAPFVPPPVIAVVNTLSPYCSSQLLLASMWKIIATVYVQDVQEKLVVFTIHCNPFLANIAVRNLQSSQHNASVRSLLLLAGNILYNQ